MESVKLERLRRNSKKMSCLVADCVAISVCSNLLFCLQHFVFELCTASSASIQAKRGYCVQHYAVYNSKADEDEDAEV